MTKENPKMTVKWFLLDKNPPVIKFDEKEESYTVSDNVIAKSNFDKYPINKGDVVEVGIKGNEVIFLKKQNKFANKSGDSKKASGTSGKKTLTIEAIYNDESIKFKEENIDGKKWCKVSDEISAKGLKNLGVEAKNQITITLDNGIITEIELVASEKSEEKVEAKNANGYSKKSSYRDEESMDKRTALMTAKDIVVALIEAKNIEKKDIVNALKDLTNGTYNILQNL